MNTDQSTRDQLPDESTFRPIPADDRLLLRGLRQGWPMPPNLVALAIKRAEAVLADPKTRPRMVLHTIKALHALQSSPLAPVQSPNPAPSNDA